MKDRVRSFVVGAAAALAALLPQGVRADPADEPPPSAVSAPGQAGVPTLEKRSYIHNMKVLAQSFAGENREAKMQMMAIGERRYLIQAKGEPTPTGRDEYFAQIIDVSNPMKPVVVADHLWPDAFQIQVAYSKSANKWIAMASRAFAPLGGAPLTTPGLRGIELYDISDPRKPVLLSQWSTDGGDPKRQVQQGTGTHRNYWDGGRYAYLSVAPDNSFLHDPASGKISNVHTSLQVIDLLDPAHPKLVSNWHLPGQRIDEAEQRKTWKSYGDVGKGMFDGPMHVLHGGFYMPRRVEEGGKLAYSPWGSFGMLIHDMSDPANPRLISQWQPDPYVPGGLPFHTIDVARLDRGFVITNPEAIKPQCKEQWHDSYVIDVSDPAHPKQLGVLPIPKPPAAAPYKSFCERYGRFGTHNPPHLKAPGKPAPNFTCMTYFAGGLQCYDITDPRNPKISAYFVPSQGGAESKTENAPGAVGKSIRTADNVFVEWDRRLIWLAADSGLYLLSAPQLGTPILQPMKVKAWALPSINEGFEKSTAQP